MPVKVPVPVQATLESTPLWEQAQPVIAAHLSRLNRQEVLRGARIVRLTNTLAVLAVRPGMRGPSRYLLRALSQALSGVAGRRIRVALEGEEVIG